MVVLNTQCPLTRCGGSTHRYESLVLQQIASTDAETGEDIQQAERRLLRDKKKAAVSTRRRTRCRSLLGSVYSAQAGKVCGSRARYRTWMSSKGLDNRSFSSGMGTGLAALDRAELTPSTSFTAIAFRCDRRSAAVPAVVIRHRSA